MRVSINPDGSAVFENSDEGKTNPDGSQALKTWTMDANQVGPHLRGMPDARKDPTPADHPFQNLTPGDKTAARDAAAQYDDRVRIAKLNGDPIPR